MVSDLAGKFLGGKSGQGAELLATLSKLGFKPEQIESFLPKALELIKTYLSPELIQKILASLPALAAMIGAREQKRSLTAEVLASKESMPALPIMTIRNDMAGLAKPLVSSPRIEPIRARRQETGPSLGMDSPHAAVSPYRRERKASDFAPAGRDSRASNALERLFRLATRRCSCTIQVPSVYVSQQANQLDVTLVRTSGQRPLRGAAHDQFLGRRRLAASGQRARR